MDAYHRLLTELGTEGNPHMKGSLYRHLQGTHDLLRAWGNPADVCTAGLFHSVYGTVGYDRKSADLDSRDQIAQVIGARAEELAYLFCASERRQFLPEIESATPCLVDRFTGSARPVSLGMLAALIEIEVANYLEQNSPYTANFFVVRYMKQLLGAGSPCMSEPAREALERFIRQAETPLARLRRLPKRLAWEIRAAMRLRSSRQVRPEWRG